MGSRVLTVVIALLLWLLAACAGTPDMRQPGEESIQQWQAQVKNPKPPAYRSNPRRQPRPVRSTSRTAGSTEDDDNEGEEQTETTSVPRQNQTPPWWTEPVSGDESDD